MNLATGFAAVTLSSPTYASLASELALVQSQSRPLNFFWAGVLMALVPVLIFAGLTGTLIYLYLREVRSRAKEHVSEADR